MSGLGPARRGAFRLGRLGRGAASVLGPSCLEVQPRRLGVGEGWCRSFSVIGYPREVGLGWLEPLSTYPGRLDVALHVDPVPARLAADRLRRQLARLESDRRLSATKGRLLDPEVEVAAEDARVLADGIARGEERLFQVGLYLTVHARTLAELDAECTRVSSLCSSLLLQAQPTTFRSLQGYATTLPLGIDAISSRRSFDTAALAASFPFASAELSGSGGVLYGTSARGSGLVCWDRFAKDNHNAVILARSGAGKSFLAKLEALRHLYVGTEVLVVDPEDEYGPIADALGGAVIRLGAPGVRYNPFDLGRGEDALIRRALFLHSLVAVLLGEGLDPAARAALDRCVLATYEALGITADPRTHHRKAPILADLARVLEEDGDEGAFALARRLAPYVSGSHRGLFDGPTTTRPEGQLVVFSLRDLPEELKAAGSLLTLDALWRSVSDPTRRRERLVLVDEAWLLMREEEGARFLLRMAKSARKHRCGLTVVTQDAADLLDTSLGKAVVSNAATQILLRQAPQAIDALAEAFGLSAGERGFLLGARRGEGLLVAGTERVAFQSLASDEEHELIVPTGPHGDGRRATGRSHASQRNDRDERGGDQDDEEEL